MKESYKKRLEIFNPKFSTLLEILKFVNKNEHCNKHFVYRKLGYGLLHIQTFIIHGLIEEAKVNGRSKAIKLTKLGKDVLQAIERIGKKNIGDSNG